MKRTTLHKNEGKVVLVHNLKAYGELEVQCQAFLLSAVEGGEGSASRTARFTTEEGGRFNHGSEGVVDTKCGLEVLENRTFSCFRRGLNKQFSIVHP
jgi:hypothetical protein